MVGRRFGSLVVIQRSARGGSYWDCRCDCGTTKQVRSDHLKAGRIQSCGCQTAQLIAQNRARHGHARTDGQSPTYGSWRAMIVRCEDPSHSAFCFYGGRGITVCDRWRNSFDLFLADMGERPEGTTIDRIDTDGNYEPGNCRWAQQPTQLENQRHRIYVEYEGCQMLLTDAAKLMGIQENTLRMRIRRQRKQKQDFVHA